MNFGAWDTSVHEGAEQQKRIVTAKKPATTPTLVDHENKSAEFKGSGKAPYITTLDSCTCVDFVRRKLPCKHIYRLALELEGADIQQGVNKNEYAELPYDVYALPVDSQEILYDMCVAKIYHGENTFMLDRNEFTDILFEKGFCVENILSVESLSMLPLPTVKHVINTSAPDMEGLPKKQAQRKTVISWLQANFENISAVAEKNFVCFEFSEHADKLKSTIHRRFTKLFERVETDYGEGITSDSLKKIFIQNA